MSRFVDLAIGDCSSRTGVCFRKLGISLMPHEANFDRIQKASWPELVQLGIVRVGADGNDELLLDSMEAAWTLRSAYT